MAAFSCPRDDKPRRPILRLVLVRAWTWNHVCVLWHFAGTRAAGVAVQLVTAVPSASTELLGPTWKHRGWPHLPVGASLQGQQRSLLM